MRFSLPSIIAVLGLVAATQAGCASAHHDLLADLPALPPTPPMGWNSWDSGIKLTEHNVEATIYAMVASGMRDAGYRYVNLDAGWAAPVRGPHGELQVDPRFPDGMAAVARYAHDRGLLLGLYASPYDEGCSAQPALASVDHDTQVRVFTKMRDALRNTGRRILYSINPNSSVDYTAGARYDWSGIADMTSATTDLYPLWRDQMPALGPYDPFPVGADLGVPDEFTAATQVVTSSRPGYWADADMLVAGLGWDQWTARHFASIRNSLALTSVSDDQLRSMLLQQPNLSDTEQRTHLSLWAMLSAPLIAGNDIRSMTPQTRDILTNRDVIAVDQDPKVAPAHALANDPRVFVKPLSDGSVAAAFFNSGEDPVTMGTTAGDIGLAKAPCYSVRDLWSHGESTSAGALGIGALPAHATALLRVSGGCG